VKSKEINPFVLQRRQNIQTLKEIIREDQPIKYDTILATLGVYGLTRKTINDYIETLTMAKMIKFDTATRTYSIVEHVETERSVSNPSQP